MKGHIRERSPGKWAIVLDVADPATGARKRKWHSFAGTKREAQNECARLIASLNGGTYVEPTRETVGDFLKRWLASIKSQVSARTYERYAEIATKNLTPLLGSVILAKLKPPHVSAAYAAALESGRRDGKGGLSPRTVHHMHRILRQALQQAVVWEVLNRNPADAVKPPKVERKAMRAPDAAETAALLDAIRETRIFIPTMLAVLCGLRRGEVVALRWKHVDLDRGQLSVEQSAEQTKSGVRLKETKNGRARTVALPRYAIDELRRWRAAQAEELLVLGIRLGADTPVVAQATGEPLQPNSLTHEFVRLTAALEIPRLRFHDLRHGHATQLLAGGVHPKVAQERLGHSSVAVTIDLYSHVLPGMQEDAAARVDAALHLAIQKRSANKG